MKKFLLLILSAVAITANAQVYTEYFTHTDPKPDGTAGVALSPGDPIEVSDALNPPYWGWYLSAKSTNRQTGVDGQASPLISPEDALFYGDYKGDEMGQPLKYDSAVAYVSDQRDEFWAVNNRAGDTLKMPESGILYTAFLFMPKAESKNSYRDFIGYEWSPTNNTSRGRIAMNYQKGDVNFGVSKNTLKVEDGLDTITIKNAVDQTFLMVMKYEMGEEAVANDDTVRLYINPDPLKSEAEQTGIILKSKDPSISDRNVGDIVRLRIRQRGMNALIGGIRVGTDWTEVMLGIKTTGVRLDNATMALALPETPSGTLVATVVPANADNQSVTWSSSNEAVATVADGVVTGLSAGEATITVTTDDGSFTADCVVTVASTVGVADFDAKGYSIYPNPISDGVLYLKLSGTNKASKIEIFNTLGALVHSEKVDNRSDIAIQTSRMLDKGVYFVKVNNNSGSHIEQIIVQ